MMIPVIFIRVLFVFIPWQQVCLDKAAIIRNGHFIRIKSNNYQI